MIPITDLVPLFAFTHIYKTTTTTEEVSTFELTGEDDCSLVYPKRLLGGQREVANRYLRILDPGHRQMVLDELEGRFRAEGQGMKPLYDELSFFACPVQGRAVRDVSAEPRYQGAQ